MSTSVTPSAVHTLLENARHDNPVASEMNKEVSGMSSSEVKEEPQNVAPSDSDYPDGGFKAWLVVLGGFFSTFSTFGYMNAWGVFQTYYHQALLKDTSVSSIAWIGSIQLALTFGVAVFVGRLFDMGIFKIPAICASVAIVVFTILIAECRQYWQFLLCQGIALGIASGVLFGPTLAVVAHWFKKRRNTAMGIVASGSSLGGTVIPIFVQNLIPKIGFRWTIRVLALILLCSTAILNVCLRRRLTPVPTKGGIFNFQAFKYPPFAFYTLGIFTSFLGLYTLLTFVESSANDIGISPSFDVYFLAFANAASAAGRISTGLIADRLGCMTVMLPGIVISAICTYVWPFATSIPGLLIVSLIYGFASGVVVSLQAVPLMMMGDMTDVGRRSGTLFTILSIGALVGPPISGAIAAATGNFKAVGFYAGSVVLLSALILWYVRYLMTGSLFRGKF